MSTSNPRAGKLVPPELRAVPMWHALLEWAIRGAAAVVVTSIALIFVFVAKESLPLWTDKAVTAEVTPAKMFTAQLWLGYDAPDHVWQPVSDTPKYGAWPLVVGTLKVCLIALAVALPLAFGSALFVSQFAPAAVREIVKPAVELLAGIPSVVLGFFALMVLASWLQNVFGFDSRLNCVVAGVALAAAVVPIVFTLSEEALGAVPQSFIEASTSLGAARWQTALFVVLPAARPGLLAAATLGFGRAIGETMIVLLASGNAAILSPHVADSARSVAATIAAELAEVVFGGAHYTVLFFLGTLLLLSSTAINLVSDWFSGRMRRRLGL